MNNKSEYLIAYNDDLNRLRVYKELNSEEIITKIDNVYISVFVYDSNKTNDKVRNIYLNTKSFLDDNKYFTTFIDKYDDSKFLTEIDALSALLKAELLLDLEELNDDDITYLGDFTTSFPAMVKYSCYAIDISKYINTYNGYENKSIDSFSKFKVSSLFDGTITDILAITSYSMLKHIKK